MTTLDSIQPMQAPNFRIEGKRALVTGGSRGIGLAAAFALAHAGAQVIIAARDAVGIDKSIEWFASQGFAVDGVVLDVTDSNAVRATVTALGPIHILVNNAGGNRPGLLKDMSPDDLQAVLALNVTSSMVVSQVVIDGLIAAGQGGSIINLSSQYGHIGAPERAIYSAAKHGVEGYTKSLAWEVGRYGIRVNTIAPSMIETDMTRARLEQPGVRDELSAKAALGRIGMPEDLMGAVVFLASDASAYVTGASIRVDGGTTAV